MTDPVIRGIEQAEINKMFKYADKALNPQVEFNRDFEKMKEEAEYIKSANLAIIWSWLSKIKDES